MIKKIIFLILALTIVSFVSSGCVGEKKKEEPKTPEKKETVKAEQLKVKPEEEKIVEAKKQIKTYIMDFDSGAKPNRLGGDFGAWDKDPADFSQTCTESFDPSVKHGDSGFSMRLDYDVDSPNPAYNGFWAKLNNFDASGYKNLVIWIKGDAEAGYTKAFKIELKSSPQQVNRYYIKNVTDKWKKFVVPLDKMHGDANLSSLSEFVICFEDRIVTQKEGTIWIDDVYFTK